MTAALIIFIATYLVLAAGRVPWLRIDRTGAAIIGAALMIAFRVLTLREAYLAVDYRTIVLLFGMMILVANLRLSGAFAIASEWVAQRTRRPIALLAAVVIVAGILSAFFVNDTICVALTPLVLELAISLRRNPIPYLLGVAMASNIGSVATITGNPQNILIGSFSGIHYRAFALALAPVAALGLAASILVIGIAYRAEFSSGARLEITPPPVRVLWPMLVKSVIVSLAAIILFFAGWPPPEVALIAAAVLLVTRRLKPERIYAEIDWSLLALFAGLFIVVAGVEKTPWFAELPAIAAALHLNNIAALTGASAVLSNIVSNVPAVLLFKSLIPQLADPRRAWLVLAMSSTLAGNLTIVGSVANLIVVQRARHRATIGFWEYFRVGAPLTLITLLIGILFLR